jgi:hypothetical protein
MGQKDWKTYLFQYYEQDISLQNTDNLLWKTFVYNNDTTVTYFSCYIFE